MMGCWVFAPGPWCQGPSLLMAYSPCIDWGIDMSNMMGVQQAAVDAGYWPLYRYDPRLVDQGKPPLVMDQKKLKRPVKEFLDSERRFQQVKRLDPEAYERYAVESQLAAERRMALYQHMAQLRYAKDEEAT